MRKHSPKIASILSLVVGSAALATGGIYNQWVSIYPDSDSDLHGMCALCHQDPGGGEPWNAYGWRIRAFKEAGFTTTEAILAVEEENSDDDPGGYINLEEIFASTQPGWTDGPVNNIYWADGTIETGIAPPPELLGTMDPVACPADIDGDGTVAVTDLLAVLGAWGEVGGAADVNGDGIVDVQDLLLVLGAWGAC